MVNKDQSMTVRRSRTSATSDGRFGSVNHDAVEGRPSPADQYAKYFVFGEGRNLWCAYAEGSRYTETVLKQDRDVLDPPPQLCLCPWASVGPWLDEMGRRGVVPEPLGAGTRYTATRALGASFSLEFGPGGELTACEFDYGDARSRWEYSEFHNVDGRPIPSRLRDFVLRLNDGTIQMTGEGVARLDGFECNTPDVLESVKFDPVALNVRYFDEGTGTVYSPDRTRALFTINEAGRTVNPWWSRSWLLGVVASVGVSLAVVWRRWRRGM